MSDKNSESGSGGGPQFSVRELELLGFAMRSLKSGPPEIDYDKLAAFAGMSNPRSASNAWAKIRNKLMTPGDGTSSPKAKETPKKKGTTKANGKSKGDDQNGDGASVTPKSRKRASKKQDVDGDASPTKKSRPSKANTVADVEDNIVVKAEHIGDSQDTQPENTNGAIDEAQEKEMI